LIVFGVGFSLGVVITGMIVTLTSRTRRYKKTEPFKNMSEFEWLQPLEKKDNDK